MRAPFIADPDESWPRVASALMDDVREAVRPHTPALDHIGSTAVPGLAAKPILDLQMLFVDLPSESQLARPLAPLGFAPARGSRPDSPGVTHDIPRRGTDADEALHRKLLFHRPAGDLGPEVILHVRRVDSPFAAFVLAFRDWLRADPAHAARYEAVKREIASRYADADDYDDYTLAKGAFLDEVQREMSWP